MTADMFCLQSCPFLIHDLYFFVTMSKLRVPLMEQQRFTLPEHMNSPLFFRGWRWSIFRFMDLCLFFVNFHCVVCSSSTYGFWLLFWNLQFFFIEMHIYSILMKNSKVHKVWMLIIKKRKSYKQVYTFCMNKYKQNEKELQNTLMLFNVC